MKTILVVDDNDLMREVCVCMLRKRTNYSLIEARDGDECLHVSLNQQPDLVLMDIEMPRKNGLAACEILKSDPKYHRPPVILMTAHQLGEIESKASAAGADSVLEKPLNWNEVVAVLGNIM